MAYTKIVVVSDAACRVPNAHLPGRSRVGKAACGFVILDEQEVVLLEGGKHLGELTVPQAEYNGLIYALDSACSQGRGNVDVWLDSEFIVKQLNGDYRIKSDNMKPLYDEVKKLERRFTGKISYFHHPRTAKWAKQADHLANAELNKKMAP